MTKNRVRLSGSKRYETSNLFCEKCGVAIIKNHEAQMPIYYVIDFKDWTEEEMTVCTGCA